MKLVFRERHLALGRIGGDELRVERPRARLVLLHACRLGGEDQPEKMGGPSAQDGVGLGAGEGEIAAHLGNAAQVVALVEAQR